MPSWEDYITWQSGVVLLLLVVTGVWIVYKVPQARSLLAVLLGAGSLLILAYYGILSGKKRDPKKMDRANQTLSLFVLVYAMLFTLFSIDLVGIVNIWILVMGLFVIFLSVIGVFITGRAMGLFIDSKNRMSLSTLQTILWTVVLLSAFFTVAAALIQGGKGTEAFNIALDPRLWALMGISVTTLAGTPLIKDVKSTRKVSLNSLKEYARRNSEAILERVHRRTGDPKKTLDTITEHELREAAAEDLDGPLWKAPDTDTASPLDLFRGDEGLDHDRVDLGKVQMFFFTVIGALAYMLVLASWIATLTPETIAGLGQVAEAGAAVNATVGVAATTAILTFPAISEGFVAILGISHAGFLGNSATTKMT